MPLPMPQRLEVASILGRCRFRASPAAIRARGARRIPGTAGGDAIRRFIILYSC